MKTVSIIIPVYNEACFIAAVVESVAGADTKGLHKEIIIVDDGCSDGTHKQIASLRDKVTVIRKPKNEGKGAAIKSALKKATGDIILIQDADHEYSVADYPALLSPLISGKAAVVYGSRNKKRENFHNRYSYFSYFVGGLLLTWFVNLLYGTELTDQPTGYKVFSGKVKDVLQKPPENRFSYEVAVTALLAKNNHTITEVPIHYRPRSFAQGKKINIADFIKSIAVAVKYRFYDGNKRV